jgi:hypothetical protein
VSRIVDTPGSKGSGVVTTLAPTSNYVVTEHGHRVPVRQVAPGARPRVGLTIADPAFSGDALEAAAPPSKDPL